MMKPTQHVLVTGGAGFIGRWLCKALLEEGHSVIALDDFSNGSPRNIQEFKTQPNFIFIRGSVLDHLLLLKIFQTYHIESCYHLAAQIIVQNSLDNPEKTFWPDVVGTFQVLEECRKKKIPFLFMSTCMVYDFALAQSGIDETSSVLPRSPYAGAKLAAENMVLSYYHGYNIPTVIVRPFNTYGPFQKSGGDGGVIPIFLSRAIKKQKLTVYGDGTQTRDFLYVTDCISFLLKALHTHRAYGQIFNAGTGDDISINSLAKKIAEDTSLIEHVPHIHPQSEIMILRCNAKKAKEILGWKPKVSLDLGFQLTKDFLMNI